MTDAKVRPAGYRVGLSLIVTSVAVALTAGAVLSVGIVGERNARKALATEMESRLLLSARNLALGSSSPLLSEFPELTLHPMIKTMQAHQPELGLAVVVDHDGRIQGHQDSRLIGSPFQSPEGLTAGTTNAALGPGETLRSNAELMVGSAPVMDLAGRPIGAAMVGLKRAYIDGIFAEARRQQLIVLLVALLLSTAAAFVLMTLLLKPIGALRAGLERIGRGDLETPVALRDMTELGMLADTVDSMAAALKQARIEMLDRERLSRELELAREIQDGLLPLRRTVAQGFVVEGTHRAAAEVGGDYFDILPLPGGRLAIAVADVAGKGLGGCLIMSMLSAMLRALKDGYESPSALLIRLDEQLSGSLRSGSFVTMFYGVLDPATGALVYASAGHCPTLIHRRATGTVEQVRSRGIPLGAIRGGAIRKTLKDESTILAPGDMVLQYTDGIYEAFDTAGKEQYGLERMTDLLARSSAGGSQALLEAQRKELDLWRGDQPRGDDETLLVISREIAVPVATPAEAVKDGPREALAWLAEARLRGESLELPARMEAMSALPAWVAGRTQLAGQANARLNVVATALYEVCTNIVEHGYRGGEGNTLELWWVPPASESEPCGHFVIRDQGAAFSADEWKTSNFADAKVRRQGRGFGLDIIHRAACPVAFRPATPEGNITRLSISLEAPSSETRNVKHG